MTSSTFMAAQGRRRSPAVRRRRRGPSKCDCRPGAGLRWAAIRSAATSVRIPLVTVRVLVGKRPAPAPKALAMAGQISNARGVFDRTEAFINDVGLPTPAAASCSATSRRRSATSSWSTEPGRSGKPKTPPTRRAADAGGDEVDPDRCHLERRATGECGSLRSATSCRCVGRVERGGRTDRASGAPCSCRIRRAGGEEQGGHESNQSDHAEDDHGGGVRVAGEPGDEDGAPDRRAKA
jgi:hypothetical protein